MKLRIIYTFFALSLGAFLFFGHTNGRAASQNQGNTGAPGDEALPGGAPRTCQSCHNSGSFAVSVDIVLTDAGGNEITTSYTPGEVYDVKLTINSMPAPAGYGFQAVALAAPEGANGPSIDTWSDPSANAQIATASMTGRQYAEHNGVSASEEFTMKWTAPAAGTGNVTFYYCGNAVDIAGGNNGDNATCASRELTDASVSINDPNAVFAIDIFPNPVADVLHLKTTTQQAGIYQMMIFDQLGKVVKTLDVDVTVGEKINFIEVSNLASGQYTLVLTDENDDAISKKIIKQ